MQQHNGAAGGAAECITTPSSPVRSIGMSEVTGWIPDRDNACAVLYFITVLIIYCD